MAVIRLLLVALIPQEYVHCTRRKNTTIIVITRTTLLLKQADLQYRIAGNFYGVKNSFIKKTVIFVSISLIAYTAFIRYGKPHLR